MIRKKIALLLSLAMAVTSVPAMVTGTMEAKKVNAQESIYQGMGEPAESIYHGDGFDVAFSISSKWDTGYIGNITITNTGDKNIENWELSYLSADDYDSIWNATVTYHSATIYNVKNNGYNSDIAPGQSVSFGYKAVSSNAGIDKPEGFKLLGDVLSVCSDDVEVTYNINSLWNNGGIIDVTLHNISDENIEDWTLSFSAGFNIDNIWRAKLDKQDGNSYTVNNLGYNSIIKPDESETFGMQVSFSDALYKPETLSVTQYKKSDYYMEFDKEWNRMMIHADDKAVVEASKENADIIKIGVIDSGVDNSQCMNVTEFRSFLDEYEDPNPLFADISGHGTAAVALLASDSSKADGDDCIDADAILRSDSEDECSTQSDADNTGNSTDAGTTDVQDAEYLNEIMNEKIDGVNPNVEIYSAGVLDSDNETTVDRLVEGIEWAMECGVKILDINCGLETDSAKLHAVIKKAYKQGILIIAPAGNGKAIEYPAKYPEVMAVGAVKCNANLLECSVHGEELEVVAPGADVTTYGAFEMLTNESGTSMAAPQVAALASILWQKDVSKSADFIRSLIDATARPLGAKEDFGYGLIDCSYALKQYDEFKEKYQEAGDKTDVEIEDNDAALLLTDESLVKGFWKSHQALIYFNDNIKNVFNNIVLINKGAIWPDLKDTKQEDNKQKDTKLKDTETGKKKVIGSGLANMHVNPAFHGYFQKDWKLEGNKSVKLDSNDIKDSNYILAYMTITKYAEMLYTSDDADIYKEYGKIIEWFKENYKVTEEEEASKEEIIKALYDSTLIAFDNIHSSYYLGLFEIKEGKDLNNKTDFKDKAVMKHEYTKEDVKEIDNNKSRAYFVYGIAMHTMEDIFAHSTKGYNCTAVGSTNIVKLYPSKKYYDTAKHNYTSKDVNLTIGKFGRLIHNGLYAYYYNNVKDAKDNKDVKNDKKGYLTLSTANMFDNDKYGYNFADDMNCAPNRWESALNISQEMINELIIRASANKKKKNIFVIDRLVFANIAYIKKDKNSIQYYEIINLKKYLKPENGDLDKLERNLQTKLKEIDKKLSGNPLTADKKKLKKEKNGYIKKLNLLNMIDNAIDSVNTDNTR